MTVAESDPANAPGTPPEVPRPRRLRLFPSPPTRIGGFAGLRSLFWAVEDPRIVVTSRREPPAGFRTTETYTIVPDAERPRYLVATGAGSSPARALTAYGGLRTPVRRGTRIGAATAFAAGLGPRVLGRPVFVHVRDDVSDAERTELSLAAWIEATLGRGVLPGVIGLGGGGPFAKPVAQLVRGGRPAGFLKIGWDTVTRRSVANEARALERYSRAGLRSVRVPRLLAHDRWRALELTVASPLPPRVRRFPPRSRPPLAPTREIHDLDAAPAGPLWTSGYAAELERRIATMPETVGATLRDALTVLRDRRPHASASIGPWHGDWVPWNLAVERRALHAWDWEYSAPAVPLGFDVAHLDVQTAFVGEKRPLDEAIATAMRRSAGPMTSLGVDDPRLVVALYLFETAFRAGDAVAAGANPNPRLWPRIGASIAATAREI